MKVVKSENTEKKVDKDFQTKWKEHKEKYLKDHKDGKKYKDGKILPQEKDWATSEKAKSATIFKRYRDLVTTDKVYISMRKNWREFENANNNIQKSETL